MPGQSNITRKRYILVIAFTALIAAVIFWPSLTKTSTSTESYLSYNGNGPCDLRDFDFTTQYARIQTTDVEFFPNAYLMPDELPPYYTAPSFSTVQYATERICFLVPDDAVYSLTFMLPGYAGRVFINGEQVREIGKIGSRRSDIVLDYKWCVLQVVPQNGRIELVIQAASFVRTGHFVELPTINIGKADIFQPEQYLTNPVSMLVMGGLFGAALLLFGIWLFHSRMTQNLWFALECLMMAIRAGITGDTLQRVFPFVSRMASLKTEYASTALLMIFLTMYFDKTFPGVYQKRVRDLILSVSALYSVMCYAFPTELVSVTFSYSYALVGIIILYFSIRLCMKLRGITSDQTISLAGVAVFFIGALGDLLYFSGFRDYYEGQGTMIETAMLIFVVIQMIALFVGNARKTSEAREAERIIAEKNAVLEEINRHKTEFLSNISHELKTPLTVVSAHVQLSRQGLAERPGTEELQTTMKLISGEVERMGLMVGQLLDVSRIDEGGMTIKPKRESAVEIIQSTLNTYYPVFTKNRNELIFKKEGDIPSLLCDRARVMQVLVNLISNAARHTRGGTITVSVRTSDNDAVITVSDTGEGIAAERIPSLFVRYKSHMPAQNEEARTGWDTGTGLGLYICKHIVEAHGGHITLDSEPHKGTRVTFTLPLET